MDIFQLALILAAFLCSLTAGLVFAFAIVVMPGISDLDDREFIRAFQVMDRVIQNNQPIFMLAWVGSVVALLIAAVLGFGQLDGVGRVLIIVATVGYLVGVQFPTATINIPLNNQIQALDVDSMDETSQSAARKALEPRWNRWNSFRTAVAGLVTNLLMILLLKL